MKSLQSQSSKNLYVGLKDPRELRRNLLEASKSTITSMQIYQKVKSISSQKAKLKGKLKDDVKELNILLAKLEKLMPKNVVEEAPAKVASPKKQPPKAGPEEAELQNIHSQLLMIEKKLKQLDK